MSEIQLPPGAFMNQSHQYWFNGEGPHVSVTTVLDGFSKPALITWKAKESARALFRSLVYADQFPDLPFSFTAPFEDDAVNWALKESDKARDTAAKLGSSIHLLADMVSRGSETPATGFQVSEQEKPYLEAWSAFLVFLEAHSATIISSEKMVWAKVGYAGTYDLIIQFGHCVAECHNGELWLIDIKTSKGYYPEYGLQLAAYGYADWIILLGNPTPYDMPHIDRYGVLHLRPDAYPKEGWRLIEYPVTDRDYIAFLGALEVYKWKSEGRFTRSILNKLRTPTTPTQESPAIDTLTQE